MSQKLLDTLVSRLPGALIEGKIHLGDTVAVVRRESWLAAARILKEDPDCGMDHFIDLTCVDWPQEAQRFEVVLHLRSSAHNHRIRMKTRAGGAPPAVASLTPLYKGADWFEREAWDMYGVRFEGHPDLRRILNFETFDGHPLRKDYPKRRRQCPIPLRKDAPHQPPPFKERP